MVLSIVSIIYDLSPVYVTKVITYCTFLRKKCYIRFFYVSSPFIFSYYLYWKVFDLSLSRIEKG